MFCGRGTRYVSPPGPGFEYFIVLSWDDTLEYVYDETVWEKKSEMKEVNMKSVWKNIDCSIVAKIKMIEHIYSLTE